MKEMGSGEATSEGDRDERLRKGERQRVREEERQLER